MKNLNPVINSSLVLTLDDYEETTQAEMTSRLLQDHEYNLVEWYGYGTIAGLRCRATYITGPEDDHIVECNGGDWGGIDWFGRLAQIDIITDDYVPVVTLFNPDYDHPDQDWEPDEEGEEATEL